MREVVDSIGWVIYVILCFVFFISAATFAVIMILGVGIPYRAFNALTNIECKSLDGLLSKLITFVDEFEP